MADKRVSNKNKSLLRREYHLPLPDNKIGRFLSRPVRGPKPLRIFAAYVRESRHEVKKVTWPTRKESLRLTLAVIVFSMIFAGYTTVLDLGFEKLVETLFL